MIYYKNKMEACDFFYHIVNFSVFLALQFLWYESPFGTLIIGNSGIKNLRYNVGERLARIA